MDNIINYIEQVKEIIDDMYSSIFKISGKELLKNGGCYEFAKIMQNKFENSKIYLRFDLAHCAILIDDILYDADGIVKKVKEYHEANQKEIKYMEENYGKDYKALNISENFLNYINVGKKFR